MTMPMAATREGMAVKKPMARSERPKVEVREASRSRCRKADHQEKIPRPSWITRGLVNVSHSRIAVGAHSSASAARRRSSASRSSAVSHSPSWGGRRGTGGRGSRAAPRDALDHQSQRQPRFPESHAGRASAGSGPPNTVAMGTAVMNRDTMRARSDFGNQ